MRGSWARGNKPLVVVSCLLQGDSGSIAGGIQSNCGRPHSAELVTFPLKMKMVARKLVLKHKGIISSNLQVLPKGKIWAIFRPLESDLCQ